MIRHLVLFRVHDEVTDEVVEQALEGLRGLAGLPGVLEWRVELSLDTRKGRVVTENALFASAEALQAFRVAPEHAVTSALMAQISDWLVGDYLER